MVRDRRGGVGEAGSSRRPEEEDEEEEEALHPRDLNESGALSS